MSRFHPRPDSVRPSFCAATLFAALCLCPAAAAQAVAPPETLDDQRLAALEAELAAERAARQALMTELAAERAARQALAGRVGALEAEAKTNAEDDDLESQLRGLIAPEAFTPVAGNRTAFPSAFNPRIGVYSDAVLDVGSGHDEAGIDGDRFSLREVEVDFRLPFSPWGEGVLVTAFEDEGEGSYHATVEEGYAALALGGLFDTDSAATAKVGRFRLPFGHDNQLHTHDLLQVDRSVPVQYLLGEEGIIGNGIEVAMPLHHAENADGLGRTTTGRLAVVNGDVFTGEESLLSVPAEELDVDLTSDNPVFVARLTHYTELTELSDVEVGVSALSDIGGPAVTTSSGQDVDTTFYGADVTWRSRDSESGVGSWLVALEGIRSELHYSGPERMGLPLGDQNATGWSTTVQRQASANTYYGLRVGHTGMVDNDSHVRDISPYVTYYADEFFRVRLQAQQLDFSDADDVQRLLLQFTWNFGAHLPHPYWVNR